MPLNDHSLRLSFTSSTFRMNIQDIACFCHDTCYFSRLPVELQTQVFSESISQPFGQLNDESQAPQILLLVCKGWRDLIYNTPSLWSSFEVRFGTWALNFKSADGDAVLLSRMKLWLHRSGNYALSVKLHYDPSPQNRSHPPFPAEALTLLMQHSVRWRHIDLSLPNEYLGSLRSSHLHLPQLNTLLLGLPQMSSAHLPETLDVCRLVSDCGQLTSLHINLEAGHSLTLDDCTAILSQNPSLTSCTLYSQCLFKSQPNTVDSTRVILPAMSELRLFLYSNHSSPESLPEDALMKFLGGLELYELKSLQIGWLMTTNRRAWKSSHPAFVSFLESVQPTLETLALKYLPLSEDQLLECIKAVPYLTALELLFGYGETLRG
ncbi:hypothetical protein D9757_000368 [Collybiopsis confluens]|uniref:F-box domain-containing protein n=1 Tax=Collybiopsis confluens TaxID=2823264 RepID=A0A8H5I1V3_9AGAR|nr:hypothetical protein D9757_000368 [Collybiopsis confluens]